MIDASKTKSSQLAKYFNGLSSKNPVNQAFEKLF